VGADQCARQHETPEEEQEEQEEKEREREREKIGQRSTNSSVV